MLRVASEKAAPCGEEASQATVWPRQQRVPRTLGHCVAALKVWCPDVKQVSPPPPPSYAQPFNIETKDLYGSFDPGDLILRPAGIAIRFNSTVVSDRK